MLISPIRCILYIEMFLLFSQCGTKVPSFSMISGHAAECGALDLIKMDVMTSIGWTSGPPDQKIRHVG